MAALESPAPAMAPSSLFASAIRLAATLKDVSVGKSLHAHVVKSCLLKVASVANHVLNMYCKCSRLDDAHLLFDEMPEKDVVSFSTMMSASSRCGEPGFALHLAVQLQKFGLRPNEFVFSSAIASCAKLRSLSFGEQLHTQAVISGLGADPFVKASLIDLYSDVGNIELAVSTFKLGSISDPAVVNSMVSGLVRSGLSLEALELLRETWRNSDFRFTNYSFVSAIKACGDLEKGVGEQIHGLTVKCGCNSHCFVATSLVDMYGRFGEMDSMEKAFHCVIFSDLPLYNALIVNSTQNGFHNIALDYFRELRLQGFSPDECTLSCALKACGGLRSLAFGRIIHGILEISNFKHNLVVNTALIDFYMKCGKIEESFTVFTRMNKRSTISYNTVISGLSQNGKFEEAMSFFIRMNRDQVDADLATFVSLMGSCLGHEWFIYSHAIKHGFGLNPMVENALLDSLLKRGAMKEGLDIFYKMEEPNVVSWTTVISGLTQLGFHSEAIELFYIMRSTKVSPNMYTFSSVLKACGNLSGLEQGRSIHACALKHGFTDNEYTSSSILDMYANCGALGESYKMFDDLQRRDVVSWNTMIRSYASHGYGQKALDLYAMMVEEGTKPNHVTFVSLLTACSHCGLVDSGIQLFDIMFSKHGIGHCLEHYACMVDMFGRAGMLDRAKNLIASMPFEANASIWATLLSSCRIHGNVELAKHARDNLVALGGEDSETHVVMYNMYSEVGNWEDAEKSRMRIGTGGGGGRKEPGLSWVQTV